MFLIRCIFLPISSQLEGALPGTLWNVGVGAAPEGGGKRSSPFAGVLGYPSGPTIGVCHRSWLDGDRQRREIAVSQVPGSADQALRRRDGTSRGVAVCLCFPAIREISRGCYQGAPFGVPPPSFLIEGGSLNPPFTRRDLRAAMTLGRRKEDCNAHQHSLRRPREGGDP